MDEHGGTVAPTVDSYFSYCFCCGGLEEWLAHTEDITWNYEYRVWRGHSLHRVVFNGPLWILFWKIRLCILIACQCVCLCVCLSVWQGWGRRCLPSHSDISVRLTWMRRCYLSRSYCKADRSLSSWPLLPVFLCFNALSLCQWTHSSHYGCTCAFY